MSQQAVLTSKLAAACAFADGPGGDGTKGRGRGLKNPLARKWVAVGAALLGALLAVPAARADNAWQKVSSKDGIVIERREVSGSSFYELRATAHSPAPPEVVLDAIWTGVVEEVPPTIKQRRMLKRSNDEFLFYDQLSVPLVTDRDYTLHLWRTDGPPPGQDGPQGARWLRFETVNALGPPPEPHYVRVPRIQGAWGAAPDGTGGTLLVYVCYSDPGGQLPAWIARGAQKDQFLFDVRRTLRRSTAKLAH